MASKRQLAERFAQTLTDHDLSGFAELLHPAYVNHNRYTAPGKDGSRRHVRGVHRRVRGLSSRGGRRTRGRRQPRRALHIPWPPHRRVPRRPGKRGEVELHSIDVWRVSDGQLVEHWDELNTLEFFQQIGAVPALA